MEDNEQTSMATETGQASYEETYVHQVYDEIASHFSSTRFKPWPVVDEFLKSLPKYAVGLDIGCGNGKYLTVRKDIFIVASDRSPELLKFAVQHQPHSAVVGDVLNLPHPNEMFDFAISIAVIHHLSTPQRRRDALKAILRTLRSGRSNIDPRHTLSSHPSHHEPHAGQALVFVWALEQKTSRRGWDAGMNQDILVPWVLKTEHDKKKQTTPVVGSTGCDSTLALPSTSSDGTVKPSQTGDDRTTTTSDSNGSTRQERTLSRYYHLYRKGELEEDIVAAGGRVVRNGYDRDNWWAIFERDPAVEM